jgi:hypothetical protein
VDVRLDALARALSLASPTFVVWKGAHAIRAGGDLDGALPRSEGDAAERAFVAWTRDEGLAASVACAHAVGMTILVGCGGAAGERLVQLDLVDRKLVHGAPVWTAAELGQVAVELDGVRRLRPGAEGLARVLASRRDDEAVALVRADHDGARELGRRLGLRGRLATRTHRGARPALAGVLAVRAAASPRSLWHAARTDRARRACPVIAALQGGRRLPITLDAWLETVASEHEVARA